jgi:hypothetical protein
MKKFVYIIGIVSANLLLYGALFKVMHWPGASILLSIAIFTFCFVFLPLSLRSNYLEQEVRRNKWLYLVTFIVFTVCLIGALFKIMHWPGAGVLLLIAIPLPFVLFLPVYLYHTRKPKSQSLMNNLGVMFGLTFMAVFSALLALNVTATVIDGFALNAFNNENLLRYYKSIYRSEVQEDMITQKADGVCSYIEAIKIGIIQAASKGESNVNFNPITMPNKSMSAISFLYEKDESMKVRAEVLWGLIDEYVEIVASSDKASGELKKLSKKLLDVKFDEGLSEELQAYSWVEKEFPSNQLALVLDVLTQIQGNVRVVEMEIDCISTK